MKITTSEKLMLIINRKGLTVADIAARLDCTPQNLYKKIRRDNWSELDLSTVAAAIGCTVEYIFTDSTNGDTL